jgi:hypothetical protein
MGNFEIGPMPATEIHRVVCLEEQGRLIRLHCWQLGRCWTQSEAAISNIGLLSSIAEPAAMIA